MWFIAGCWAVGFCIDVLPDKEPMGAFDVMAIDSGMIDKITVMLKSLRGTDSLAKSSRSTLVAPPDDTGIESGHAATISEGMAESI